VISLKPEAKGFKTHLIKTTIVENKKRVKCFEEKCISIQALVLKDIEDMKTMSVHKA
jgi:hypothetical protein